MSIYHEGLLLPYTCLLTNLRMSKRYCEYQMTQILKQIINLKNSSDTKTKQQVLQQLAKSKQRLQCLKEKLLTEKVQQTQIYDICRKRVHVDKQVSPKNDELTKQQLMRQFDREVIQFFAARNKIKQAKVIQKSLKDRFQLSIEIKLYEKAYNIAKSIQINDLRPLKDWCYEHSHYLAKIKSPLQFKLISCSFVNILNNGNGAKAIQFLRKEVSTLSLSESDLQQINKLSYMVLISEAQQDYEYYSDQQKQKQVQVDEIKAPQKEKEKQQENENIQESSSSSNIEDSLKNAQQKMMSIFRVVGQLAQGAQGLLKRISGSQPILKQKKQSVDLSKLEQEIYEEEWQSISAQSNQIQSEAKQDGKQAKYKNNANNKQHIKIVLKKHKLDKNNLRTLLIQTKQQFMKAFSKIYQLSFDTYFDKTLAMGISIVKTSYCAEAHCNERHRSLRGNCPTCTKQVGRIMKKIPSTLKNESSLICRVNGSLMNEVNYPVVLPNGQVYSISGLQSSEKHGRYFCIVDSRWYRKEQCRKVFIT